MSDEEKKADVEIVADKVEDKGEATPVADVGEEEVKTPNMIEEARAERKLMEEERAKMKAENDRRERLAAESEFGGSAKMTAPVKPKVLTAREYAEALERGEVNPMREDGLI